jgi:hypothetical protein
MSLITGTGDRVRIDRTSPDFAGVVVNLGALGVITRSPLHMAAQCDCRQRTGRKNRGGVAALPAEAALGEGFRRCSQMGRALPATCRLPPACRDVRPSRSLPDALSRAHHLCALSLFSLRLEFCFLCALSLFLCALSLFLCALSLSKGGLRQGAVLSFRRAQTVAATHPVQASRIQRCPVPTVPFGSMM